VRRINDEALALLRSYPFPGNVRELHNIIERACLLAEEDTILPEHLTDEVRALAAQRTGFSSDTTVEPLADVEARYLQWALARFPDDRRSLARRLAISERTLYRKLNAAARRRRQSGQ
jgi:DNA-binding NtrC family response regulator